MRKKILALICNIIGTSSLIYCIIDDVTGIGSFALIVLGVVFIFLGTMIFMFLRPY